MHENLLTKTRESLDLILDHIGLLDHRLIAVSELLEANQPYLDTRIILRHTMTRDTATDYRWGFSVRDAGKYRSIDVGSVVRRVRNGREPVRSLVRIAVEMIRRRERLSEALFQMRQATQIFENAPFQDYDWFNVIANVREGNVPMYHSCVDSTGEPDWMYDEAWRNFP